MNVRALSLSPMYRVIHKKIAPHLSSNASAGREQEGPGRPGEEGSPMQEGCSVQPPGKEGALAQEAPPDEGRGTRPSARARR
jgi:hypothetical protein